jgi:dipeptidyl aminopeptidase/acylaminoacyl peptidase
LGTAGAALAAMPSLRRASAEGRSGASEFANALRNKIIVTARMKEAPELPGQPPVPETTGLFAIDPDTGDYQRIAGLDGLVRVSPDGTRAAFAKYGPPRPDNRQARLGTWVADLGAGKEQVKLIDPTGNICWSPRGDRLIVSEWNDQPGKGDREYTCWLVNADGSGLRMLTIPATDEVDDWSPDGDWLLTVSSRQAPGDPGYQLYVMRLDGSGERRISDGQGTNVYARFSPDGKHIAYFHRVGNNGASRILLVDLDGNNRRTLFEERNLEAPDHVAWSPDGARLVVNTMTWKMGDDGNKYISDPYEAKMRLIVLDADGKGLREIPLPRIGWLGQPQWR